MQNQKKKGDSLPALLGITFIVLAGIAAIGVGARPFVTAQAPRLFPGANTPWQNDFTSAELDATRVSHPLKPMAENRSLVNIKESQKEGHAYGNYTDADLALWEAETERLVTEGAAIFHSADRLGSTNAVSCDMCHPDAEGTHAETYPKYQVQLGRAALLRDMANWCLENPCRGEPLSGDDPRMRAMEAYMMAQRTGKPMKYGKH